MSNTKPRVAYGAKLYDELCPGWHTEVDLSDLKLKSLLALLGGRQGAIEKLTAAGAKGASGNKLVQNAGLSSIARHEPHRTTERRGLERDWLLEAEARNRTA